MIIVGSLSTTGLLFFTPTVNADLPEWPYAESCSGGVCWYWSTFGSIGIHELEIYNDILDGDPSINDDGYDDFGGASINGHFFDWNLTESVFIDGLLVGNEIIIPGTVEEETEGSTYTVTFSRNNVTFLIQSLDTADTLTIGGEINGEPGGDLGSDTETFYFTLGSHFISYAADDETGLPFNDGILNNPNFDPIFKWETNGVITSEADPDTDHATVTTTGQMLQLTHYAYAYDPEGFLNSDAFFTNFLKFIDEDKTRMDVFTVDWRPTATATATATDTATATATAYVRQSSNLTFAQSLYSSDTLSDEDGQLRATVDQVMSKYGSLIK